MMEFLLKHTVLVLGIIMIRHFTRKDVLPKVAMILWLLIPLHVLCFWTTELQFVPKTAMSDAWEKLDQGMKYLRIDSRDETEISSFLSRETDSGGYMNAHPIAIRSILLCAWGIGAVCTTALFLYRIITELRFFWKRRIFLTKRREMLVYSVSGYRNVSSVGKSIYLGEALGLDDVELDYIIRHEEAHYRNKDTLKNIGMMIYSSVFWFLPTNVLMTRWIRRDCEIASDLYATKGLSDCEKKKYCFLLLSLKKAKKQTLAMAFSEEYEDLAARIDAIKNNDGTKKKRRLVVSLTVGVILLAVFLLLIGKSCIHIPEKGKLDISKDVYVKNFIIEDGVAKFRLVNNSDTPYIIYKATIEEQTDDGWREVYKATKRKKEKCYGILPETEWLRILVPEETEVSDISRDDYLHYIRVFKVDTDNWEENGAYVLDLYITNEQRPYIVELVQFSFEK